jgi:phosphomethylpyrimidine synthase
VEKLKLKNTKEIQTGLISEEHVMELFNSNACISYIHHANYPKLIGPQMLMKVNTNIGVSNETNFESELKKLRCLSELKYAPDMMMDHTYVPVKRPLWKYMVEEFKGPVGTLPVYSIFDNDKGISKEKLLETIEEMAQGGVSFMTLQLASNISMLEIAKKCRKIPTTSRGGAIVLKDAIINHRDENVYVDNLDEILKLFKKYNMTISVGTTFRPACINEALDMVQLEEIKQQKKYIDIIKASGVSVIMEGIGHISIDMIPQYFSLINKYNTPLMPLGPMTTDASIGFDHITSAIGATVATLNGNVGVINSVTREEHTGNVPSYESVVEGLKTARVVAHSINITRFSKYREIDNAIGDNRANNKSCVIKGGIFEYDTHDECSSGCGRCRYECPLTLLN